MKTLTIHTKAKDFSVYFTHTFSFVDTLRTMTNYVVVVGEVVYKLYKKKLFDTFPKDTLIVLPLVEKHKTLDTAIRLYKKLLEKTAKRNISLISFGGGINQDVVGFVASTLYRGVNWIYVPTTLLAMADSAIGLKTSLNFESYKNMIGTFYPPTKIFINPHFLKTLPKQDYASGIGEIIKLLLMKKKAIQEIDTIIAKINNAKKATNIQAIEQIIQESIQIKLEYMLGDEYDFGKRNLLNYGHEFGHALEPASRYAIPHGIAVLIGILFANYISYKRAWISKKTLEYLSNNLLLPNIPFDAVQLEKAFFNRTLLLQNMRKDKKISGKELVLVLPEKDFSLCKVQDLHIHEFDDGLDYITTILPIQR